MELRQLRYFVALAEELHFARAAARVGIAQSPLSKSIKDFEAELAARLFTRTTRCVALTRRGEQLLHDARYLLAAAADAELRIRDSPDTDLVNVGIAEGLYHPDIPSLLKGAVGDKALRLRVMPYGRVVREVEYGSLDLGLINGKCNEPTVVSGHVFRDSIVAVMAHGHVLSQSRNLEWNSLEGELLIIGRSVAGLPQLARDNVIDTGTDIAQFAMLVGAGTGIGLCTASIASFLPRELVTRPLDGEDAFSDVYLLRSRTAAA